MNINEQANFIWSIADLLRGDFKQSEYGKVILPFIGVSGLMDYPCSRIPCSGIRFES